MSRHRDVRCMNYSDEYDGYDDVYGHSVEDDYCVSPSAEQFLFDRSKQQNIAAFITEPDIVEDNEDVEEPGTPSKEQKPVLTDLEQAKLISCMESIKNIIGDTVPESDLKDKIVKSGFNADVALDLVLKESSPKNVIESPTIGKDRVENYQGSTSSERQPASFTIPKFSIKKRDNTIESAVTNVSLSNKLESLKKTSSPLSSLSGMIASRKIASPSVAQTSSEKSANAVPFGCLAELTAHHLQKSNSSPDAQLEKISSPNTNFVIPKLSFSKTRNDSSKTQSLKSSKTETSANRQLNFANARENHVSVDSLRNSFSNHLVLSENDADLGNSSEISRPESQNVIAGTRTPSPDWTIDLSIALKEAELLTSSKTSTEMLTEVSNSASPTNFYSSNEDIYAHVALPTVFNLSSLKFVKLPYAKRNVSLFGRTLCRTWRLRRPAVKRQEQLGHAVKRFDFSTPYARK